MNFKEFVETQDPRISVIENPFDEELHRFFERNSMSMAAGYRLRYDRRPNFFDYYSARGQQAFSVAARSSDGQIFGVASFVKRQVLREGRDCVALYMSDLRFEKIPNGARFGEFKNFYGTLLKKAKSIEEFADVELIFTGILDSNQAAKRSLAGSNKEFDYVPIGKISSTLLSSSLRPLYRSDRAFEFSSEAHSKTIEAFLTSARPAGGHLSDVLDTTLPWIVCRKKGSLVCAFRLQRSAAKTMHFEALTGRWRLLRRVLFGAQQNSTSLPLVFVGDWHCTSPNFPWASLLGFVSSQNLIQKGEILVAPVRVPLRFLDVELIPEIATQFYEVVAKQEGLTNVSETKAQGKKPLSCANPLHLSPCGL